MANMKAKVLFDRALVQFHKNAYESAVELFKEAILEDPQYAEALYNLACCYSIQGKTEDALVYLDRAIKLDVNCLDWAKEDVEFDHLRRDPGFQNVLSRNDPVKKPSVGEDGMMEDEDDENEKGYFGKTFLPGADGTFGGYHPDAGKLPPCPKCGAIVLEDDVPLVHPILGLALCLTGIVVAISMFGTMLVFVLGFPLIIVGLFLYWKRKRTWVCQNCGAMGAEAGMPAAGTATKTASPALDTGSKTIAAAPAIEPIQDDDGLMEPPSEAMEMDVEQADVELDDQDYAVAE